MSFFLILITPFLALGVLAMNAAAAVKGRERLRKLGLSVVRRMHARAESVDLWKEPSSIGKPPGLNWRAWGRTLLTTRLGIWSLLASFLFLVVWLAGWTSPSYPLGFLSHIVGSWAWGLVLASAAFAVAGSFALSSRLLCAQIFASKTGLRRMWIARGGKAGTRFSQALRMAFASSQRIEILDFTGHELLAKGPTEEGGPVACLLRHFPEKEVRVLLFNPSAQEIDPDRKHTTVIQSQLVAMEMSREAFQTKIVATLNRIKALNHDRPRPIEVRLYSQKPSFRMLVAGETAFMGSIDPRDATGELPMYEIRRLSEEPSLHAAARAHFIQIWGDSSPLVIDTSMPARREAHEARQPAAAMNVA